MDERSCSNLVSIVNQIKKNEILLPDFQRDFVWTEERTQKKILASLMARIPIGTILLVNGESEEFAYKQIGTQSTLMVEILNEKVMFLLDGQQRMTVLTNAFSDTIFIKAGSIKNLVDPKALSRRFFLKIFPENENGIPQHTDNIFGANNLEFPITDSTNQLPTFLSGDIEQYIEVRTFIEGDGKWYNPYQKFDETKLFLECINPNNPKIPLYLLIPEDSKNTSNKSLIRDILNSIADTIKKKIMIEFRMLKLEGEKISFLEKYLTESNLKKINIKEPINDSEIEGKFESQKNDWAGNFLEYLYVCINNVRLHKMIVDESEKERAIDIYENLNLGGISLTIFDLVMARAAKEPGEGNYYNRLIKYIKTPRVYSTNLLPDHMENIVGPIIESGEYSASDFAKCFDHEKNKINKEYLEVFLNVLTLISMNPEFDVETITLDLLKREKKLKLRPNQININGETTCKAIDRALFFFQTRCGVREIREIHYKLMITVVSYIFSNDKYFNDKGVHKIIEAWYWVSTFSGEYDKDQNNITIESMKDLLLGIDAYQNNHADVLKRWKEKINTKKDLVLNSKNFSDKDFWTYKDISIMGKAPKEFLGDIICQFFLSTVYTDLFNDKNEVSVFMEDYDSLQKHHIVPLGTLIGTTKIKDSTKEIRGDRSCVLNSPLNFLYITHEDHKLISCKSIQEYQKQISSAASFSLLGFDNNFNTSSMAEIYNLMKSRHDKIRGLIINRVNKLLP